MIYEGSAKRLYQTDSPDLIIQEFRDDATALDGKKRAKIKNKGVLNNEISSYLFEYLEGFHIPTHYVRHLSDYEMLVKRLEIVPIELVVRNIAAGSICTQYWMSESLNLPHPIIEHHQKTDRPIHPLLEEQEA